MIEKTITQEYSIQTLEDKHCIITGASRGIGKSIALRLAAAGAKLHLLGRSMDTLDQVRIEARAFTNDVAIYEVDLMDHEDLKRFANQYVSDVGKLDILIQNAGMLKMGTYDHATPEDLDALYQINMRAPYALVHYLLPAFNSDFAQILCLNSTVRANARVSQYAATKHALKTLTDSLRAEVNDRQIRVMSLYAGRTATDMIRQVFEKEDRLDQYEPEKLLQPEDIAHTIHHMLTMPMTAEITDLTIRPFLKSY